jgi:DNA-binding GntR family transcriptional regulator
VTGAYETLRERILTGGLAPGEPLVETTLATMLGVSRTPVREALRRLEQDTLVERVHRGLQVRTQSIGEILEIYEVRIALEGTAARAAAERRTEIDQIQLEQMLHALESRQDAPPPEVAALNARLHRLIWKAGHNQTLVDVLERLNMHLVRYPTTTYASPGRPEAAHREHTQIVEAIIARDAERAEEVAMSHMTNARNTRLEMWKLENVPAV